MIRSLWFTIFLLAASTQANADTPADTAAALDGLSHLNYDSAGKFTIGDILDPSDLKAPRKRCVVYDSDKDIKSDAEGAIQSFIKVSLVRSYDDVQDDLKFSFSYHAAAKAKVGDIISGGSSLTDTGKFENFFKNQTDSMMLVIDAFADHGRNLIEKWKYDERYQKLLDENKFDEFEKACGSYFIRGKKIVSRLRVTFTFSGLQTQSKLLIANTFKGTSEGGVSLNAVSGQAQSDFSTDLAKTLTLARRLGNVTSSAEATGGTGINTVSNALHGLDVMDNAAVAGLVKGILDASSDLVRKNAAPELFILLPYPELIGRVKPFDSQNYAALGNIFKVLMRVDEQRAIYASYKTKDENLWAKYFRAYALPLDDLRKALVKRYIDCREGKDCSIPIPSMVSGIFLDDILYDGNLTVDCPVSYSVVEKANAVSANPVKFLSSINVYWRGKVRFIDDLDLLSARIQKVGPDLKVETSNLKVKDYVRVWGEAKDFKNMMSLVYTRPIDASKAIGSEGDLDYNYLISQRSDIARSIFSMKFQLLNGIELEEILGMPIMNKCNPGG